jgi:ribosomal protein S6--L-glutamate ligase
MRIGVLSGSSPDARYSNTRFTEVIEERGHSPEIINYGETIAAVLESGRSLSSVTKEGFRPVDVDVVIPRIGSKRAMGIMALEMLVSKRVPSTASPASLEIANNKFRTQILLDEHGIPTPYSVAPTGRAPKKLGPLLDLVEPDRKRPIITKLQKGSLGKGVVISDSRRSATSHIQSIPNDRAYLIQEFIDPVEDSGEHSDYRVIMVGGIDVVAMRRSTTNPEEFRANLALDGNGYTHELTDREREIAQRTAKIIGAGVLGVDIMRSKRGPLVTEVNGNPGLGIEAITGFDVVGAIVDYAITLGEQAQSGGV